MSRIFLTLLAILTGLSVTSGTAQARMADNASVQVGSVAAYTAKTLVAASHYSDAVRTGTGCRSHGLITGAPMCAVAAHVVAPVQTGIDRAHE